MRIALLIVSLSLLACSSATLLAGASKPIRAGVWGGQHVALTITAEGGSIELDCARGTLDAVPATDDAGRFEVKGKYIQEHGGPVRKDEDMSGRPARYRGTVSGEAMTLEIVLEGGPNLDPYTLTFGATPKVFKCK